MMTRAYRIFRLSILALLGSALAAPALAVPGGEIGTLPLGRYICEMPGDAAGPPRRPVPEENFVIIGASSYRAGGIRGSYLLTGDQFVMTSGPHEGKRYLRQSHAFLRRIDADGSPGKLRCVLSTRNNR